MNYLISLIACGLLLSVGAHGGTIVSVQTASALPGGSGSLDVSLTNTGQSSIVVGAFTFGISISNPNVSFTDVTTATVLDSYIFAGHSLFGPDLTGPISGPSLSASDVFDIPLLGAVVAAGATVDLGHVLFTVASNSTGGGFTTVLLAGPATSLADASGNNIAIGTLSNGTININTSVPECSPLLLLLGSIPLLWRKSRV